MPVRSGCDAVLSPQLRMRGAAQLWSGKGMLWKAVKPNHPDPVTWGGIQSDKQYGSGFR